MALMDEFRAERQAIKNAKPKEKFRYFMTYYKWHVVLVVCLVVFAFSMFYSWLNKKETILTGIMINSHIVSEDSISKMEEDFLEKIQMDSSEVMINWITNQTYAASGDAATDNYITLQVLSSFLAGNNLDFVLGDLASMTVFGYSEFFTDLSVVLSEEQMAILEPHLLYIDMAVLEVLKEVNATGNNETVINIPDFRKPESMQNPIPIFVELSSSEYLGSLFPNASGAVVFAMAANAPHSDNTAELLKLLLGIE